MKKLIIICAALLIASPAFADTDLSNSDWTQPFTSDARTKALWHLDEVTGTTAPVVDAGPQGKDGTLARPTATLQLDPNLTWVSSMAGFGNAAHAYYNSQSDSNMGAITIDDSAGELGTSWGDPGGTGDPPTDYTFEFWMNPDGAGGGWGSRILKKYTGGCFGITYDGGDLYFGWYAPGGWYGFQNVTQITQNDWTHVAFTLDNIYTGDNATSYVVMNTFYNGVLTETFTSDPGKYFSNWDTGNVGLMNDGIGDTLYGARQYTGMLDEVRISDTIRYVPEPATLSLLAVALLALRRKK
jgi:hypothetical protein